jgi:membrane protease YdiL (CAAX protease family)
MLFPIGWMLFWPRSAAPESRDNPLTKMPESGSMLREGAIGFGLGIGVLVLLYLVNAMCAWLTGQSLGSVNETAQGGSEEIFALVAISFTLAPLAEETFFRGFIYRSLRMPCGVVGALVLQAAIFAVLHSDDGLRLLSIGAIGLMLGAIYEWRQSLVAGIVAHATVNFAWAVALSMVLLMNAHSAYLGVVGEENPEGLAVRQVLPESPAAAAGLQPGDTLVSLDGAAITHRDQLTRMVRGKPVGGRVVLELTREGKPVRAEAVLTKRPRP